jgi:hypothetical protein
MINPTTHSDQNACFHPLSGPNLRAYNTIFQHPLSHNLEWSSIRSLFKELGHSVDESNGKLKLSRNEQVLVLHPGHTKDVTEADDVMSLRRFLSASNPLLPANHESEQHWVLVINHREARIFQSEVSGSTPQKIKPHDPALHFHHAQGSQETSRGKEKPDPNSFFEPVAKSLKGDGQILVVGSGKGSGSEMEQFVAWSETHHPELAKRIIGSLVVDEHHLTEGQILAKAREFYASAKTAAS